MTKQTEVFVRKAELIAVREVLIEACNALKKGAPDELREAVADKIRSLIR